MAKLIHYELFFALISISLAYPAQSLANPIQNQSTQTVASAEELAPVVSPENFFGPASMGYSAAKAVPHVCSKLFCYCGCDITDSHKCLLDCFTSLHGADCHICQEEAMLALKMTRDGATLPMVQKAVDDGYSMKYPFKTESPALANYKSTRLWTVSGTSSTNSSKNKNDSGKACCTPRRAVLHNCCDK